MTMGKIRENWDMECPECKRDHAIEITMNVNGVLTPDGTDTDAARHGEHDWDNDCPAYCQACEYSGLVKDFKI